MAVHASQWRRRTSDHALGETCDERSSITGGGATANVYEAGGTYSFGKFEPSPKKYACSCCARNSCASLFQGCSRYSFMSIFWCSPHSAHACFETFSYIFWPSSLSKGGSSSPSISRPYFTHRTMCAMCFYFPPWVNKQFYKKRRRANTKVTEAKQEVTKLLRDLTPLPS